MNISITTLYIIRIKICYFICACIWLYHFNARTFKCNDKNGNNTAVKQNCRATYLTRKSLDVAHNISLSPSASKYSRSISFFYTRAEGRLDTSIVQARACCIECKRQAGNLYQRVCMYTYMHTQITCLRDGASKKCFSEWNALIVPKLSAAVYEYALISFSIVHK